MTKDLQFALTTLIGASLISSPEGALQENIKGNEDMAHTGAGRREDKDVKPPKQTP